jgi:hypothetical protein
MGLLYLLCWTYSKVPLCTHGRHNFGATQRSCPAIKAYRHGQLPTPGARTWQFFRFRLFGAVAKLRKATISFVMSVRLSVRMLQLGSHWMNFHKILYFSFFRKSVEKIQVSLKSDETNGYFTLTHMHIYYNILIRI